jgi:hypothetical protein
MGAPELHPCDLGCRDSGVSGLHWQQTVRHTGAMK